MGPSCVSSCGTSAHGGEIRDIGDGAGDGFALEFGGEAVEGIALTIERRDARALGGKLEGKLPADSAGRPVIKTTRLLKDSMRFPMLGIQRTIV